MAVKWLDEPEAHDYDAAAAYLSMLAEKDTVDKTVAALKAAQPVYQKAKDILRAAELRLLPEANAHVRADLGKISDGKKLSPILLVRGSAESPGRPGEAVFVPSTSGPADESSGWYIGYVYDPARDGSDLVIIDASDFAAQPVARIKLPQRVPHGFHGNWIAG